MLSAANYSHMADVLEHLLEEFLARRQGVDVAAHVTEAELLWITSMKRMLAQVRNDIADLARNETLAAIREASVPLAGTPLCPGPGPGPPSGPGSFEGPGPQTY